jgi:hydroxyacylglutathione hydrolase
MLSLTPIAALSDNYVWVLGHDNGPCLIVDPGEADPVLEFINSRNMSPVAILLTHHHHDHIGGVGAITAAHPCPVIAPQDARIPLADRRVSAGDSVAIDELKLRFEVMETPGHTIGHIAFYAAPWLFCGDTLFSVGCGRLFEGSPEQMQASLDQFRTLPDDTLVCGAHEYTAANIRFALQVEPNNSELQAHGKCVEQWRASGKPSLPSKLGLERAINPFLRTREASVIQSALSREPNAGDSPEQIFGVIRRWKDQS